MFSSSKLSYLNTPTFCYEIEEVLLLHNSFIAATRKVKGCGSKQLNIITLNRFEVHNYGGAGFLKIGAITFRVMFDPKIIDRK